MAVRYGVDVVVLDGCRGRTFDINFPSKKPLDPAMRVVKISERQFKVSIQFD